MQTAALAAFNQTVAQAGTMMNMQLIIEHLTCFMTLKEAIGCAQTIVNDSTEDLGPCQFHGKIKELYMGEWIITRCDDEESWLVDHIIEDHTFSNNDLRTALAIIGGT